MQGQKPLDTLTHTSHPDAIARQAREVSEKSELLAVEILKAAVASDKGGAMTDRDIVDRAEMMWLWVTTDTWPKPAGAPP